MISSKNKMRKVIRRFTRKDLTNADSAELVDFVDRQISTAFRCEVVQVQHQMPPDITFEIDEEHYNPRKCRLLAANFYYDRRG